MVRRFLRRFAAARPLLCNAAASSGDLPSRGFSVPVVVVEEDLEGHDGHSFLCDLVLKLLDLALEGRETIRGKSRGNKKRTCLESSTSAAQAHICSEMERGRAGEERGRGSPSSSSTSGSCSPINGVSSGWYQINTCQFYKPEHTRAQVAVICGDRPFQRVKTEFFRTSTA